MKRTRLWKTLLWVVPLLLAAATPQLSRGSDTAATEQPAAAGAVSGRVIDSKGEPIIGATVIVEGTTAGTTTDIDGAFTLKLPKTVGGGMLLLTFRCSVMRPSCIP